MKKFKLALRYSRVDSDSIVKYKYACSYEYKSVFEEALTLLIVFDSPHQYIIIKKNTVRINTGYDYTNATVIDIILKQEYSIHNHFILLHEIYHGMIGIDGSWYAQAVRKARTAGFGTSEKWYPYIMFTEELMCDAFAYHNAPETFIVGGSQMPEFVIKAAAKIFFKDNEKIKLEIV